MGRRGRAVTGVAAPVVVNINEVLEGLVSLEVSCDDRLYLSAHVPNMQVGGRW